MKHLLLQQNIPYSSTEFCAIDVAGAVDGLDLWPLLSVLRTSVNHPSHRLDENADFS